MASSGHMGFGQPSNGPSSSSSSAAAAAGRPQQGHHQRTRSNVLKSFMHKRTNTVDTANVPVSNLPSVVTVDDNHDLVQGDAGFPNFSRPNALGEIQHNQVDNAPRSPTKSAFSSISKFSSKKDNSSPTKAKKTKSSTNFATILSRPKSLKNLYKQANDAEAEAKNKENRSPSDSATAQEVSRPPIYAQFSSGALETSSGITSKQQNRSSRYGGSNNSSSSELSTGVQMKPRPKSYHAQYTPIYDSQRSTSIDSDPIAPSQGIRGSKSSSKGSSAGQEMPTLNPQDINKHLEAMLDRRNIPENQRYKMRGLDDTIKIEFIRQDWAEANANSQNRPDSHGSDSSMTGAKDGATPKRTRGRSFTLSRNNGKRSENTSPTKKQKAEGTIGRHFRSRSTDSIASDRPTSSGGGSGAVGGFMSKIKLQQGPVDYVNYLRKVQKPESVEVGKLHKLRLVLRNETVAWIEDFVRLGGMQEIVGLLYRIMDVEWREEHEDALLHENLLCLKGICTTGLGLQHLHSIQATLFPALLRMLFDPEKKGPSEFTTRGIITSVLFTYIDSAPPQDRAIRAKTVLGHLHDPEPKDEERPVDFVLGMRRERPYRVWCKEVTSVTREVFWIFLHHLNVVHLPRDPNEPSNNHAIYMHDHFPQERPPVPAAPYVGGVEWDATNYLASHMDLLNAILACTPTAEERNNLRQLFQISGWERCMGGSLRLCKEKFYACIHDALRTWVAAAHEDGWNVRDVRYGPPPESRSPKKYPGAGFGGNNKDKKPKEVEAPPKIEMPKLDFGGPKRASGVGAQANQDAWLS